MVILTPSETKTPHRYERLNKDGNLNILEYPLIILDICMAYTTIRDQPCSYLKQTIKQRQRYISYLTYSVVFQYYVILL